MLDDINKKMTIGYGWSLLTKWLNRTLGLISTLCLVRILSPEDFGLLALATIILSFFVMLSDAGTGKYLIKSAQLTNEMLDTAWTLNILLKLLCAAILLLLAVPIAKYVNKPELLDILLVFCLIPIINAFKNIGLVLYERDLDFKPLTNLSVSVKLLTLPITLALAFWWQNYWALIFGLILSELLTSLASYLIHPYRPKWSMRGWASQWSFSKWHILSITTGYIRSRIDAILLGRYLSSDAVGLYRVGQEFAWLPFTEIIAPATSSLYSGLSKLVQDKEALHKSILQYLACAYLLVVPSVFAIYSFNEVFTLVLLGDKWSDAAMIIGMLAVLMLSMPLNICLQSLLTSLARIKYLIMIDLILILSIVSILLSLAQNEFNIYDYLECRIFLVFVFMLMLCFVFKKVVNLSFRQITLTILFPVLPSILTVFFAKQIEILLLLPNVFKYPLLFMASVCVYLSLIIISIMIAKNKLKHYEFIIFTLKNIKISMQNRIN